MSNISKSPPLSNEAVSTEEFGIFGLGTSPEEAELILLPVPWDTTTSYGGGASQGPRIILRASAQVDLFDFDTGKAFEKGYSMLPIPTDLEALNQKSRERAQRVIELRMQGASALSQLEELTGEVNAACEQMNQWVYQCSREILASGKKLGLIGGDHSTPFGAIRAVSEHTSGDWGILHIDAHADLREAYQGFTYSHASIMYNVMQADWAPQKLVQVGIRDFCEEEMQLAAEDQRIHCNYDAAIKAELLSGRSWKELCQQILQPLPEKVYLSVDIDGLDPALCPNTGTPVPGGLKLDELHFLLRELHASGRQIIGFDLNEVSPGDSTNDGEWDANVGARLLFKLCGWSCSSPTAT